MIRDVEEINKIQRNEIRTRGNNQKRQERKKSKSETDGPKGSRAERVEWTISTAHSPGGLNSKICGYNANVHAFRWLVISFSAVTGSLQLLLFQTHSVWLRIDAVTFPHSVCSVQM